MAVLQAFLSHIYFSSVSLLFRLLVTVSANFGYEQSVPGIYLGCICGGIIQLKPVVRITFSCFFAWSFSFRGLSGLNVDSVQKLGFEPF
jgi:hypothetical protein